MLPDVFGEEACDALVRELPGGAERVLAERERFGIDHAQCGALLAERWGLPDEVASIIAWHHGGPTGVGAPNADDRLRPARPTTSPGCSHGDEADHALLEVALDRLGLTADVLDVLAHQITHAGPAPTRPGAWPSRVAELERLSQTDDLTGLANRRHWLQTTRTALIDNGGGAIVVCAVGDLDGRRAAPRHGGRRHRAGEVARMLGHHGSVGRLGGERFALSVSAGEAAANAIAGAVDGELDGFLRLGADAGAEAAATLGRSGRRAAHGADLSALLDAAGAHVAATIEAAAAPTPRRRCNPPRRCVRHPAARPARRTAQVLQPLPSRSSSRARPRARRRASCSRRVEDDGELVALDAPDRALAPLAVRDARRRRRTPRRPRGGSGSAPVPRRSGRSCPHGGSNASPK